MLGVNGALAAGLHQRYGWQVVAVAGLAAVSPDWDGLTLIFGSTAFAEGHRVWGHNLMACVLVGILIGILDYQLDLVTRGGRVLIKCLRLRVQTELNVRADRSARHQIVWIFVAVIAALSQLPADMLVSGTDTLPDWEVKLLWPFSDRGWVYPMVPWGDVGISLIFIAGMFATIKWRSKTRLIACLTLGCVAAYIVLRGSASQLF